MQTSPQLSRRLKTQRYIVSVAASSICVNCVLRGSGLTYSRGAAQDQRCVDSSAGRDSIPQLQRVANKHHPFENDADRKAAHVNPVRRYFTQLTNRATPVLPTSLLQVELRGSGEPARLSLRPAMLQAPGDFLPYGQAREPLCRINEYKCGCESIFSFPGHADVAFPCSSRGNLPPDSSLAAESTLVSAEGWRLSAAYLGRPLHRPGCLCERAAVSPNLHDPTSKHAKCSCGGTACAPPRHVFRSDPLSRVFTPVVVSRQPFAMEFEVHNASAAPAEFSFDLRGLTVSLSTVSLSSSSSTPLSRGSGGVAKGRTGENLESHHHQQGDNNFGDKLQENQRLRHLEAVDCDSRGCGAAAIETADSSCCDVQLVPEGGVVPAGRSVKVTVRTCRTTPMRSVARMDGKQSHKDRLGA